MQPTGLIFGWAAFLATLLFATLRLQQRECIVKDPPPYVGVFDKLDQMAAKNPGTVVGLRQCLILQGQAAL